MDKLNYSFTEAVRHFERNDHKMAELLVSKGKMDFKLSSDYFESLARAIISQQISTKAANSIFAKVEAGVGGRLSPEAIHPVPTEVLRGLGLSPQKLGYIKDLTSHFIHQPEKFNNLNSLLDDEAIAALTSIKGVGKWTGQMFLIFTLGRPDVFAPDDLGLRNAMMKLYNWKTIPDKIKMEKKAIKWSPYKTVACHYLWRSLDS